MSHNKKFNSISITQIKKIKSRLINFLFNIKPFPRITKHNPIGDLFLTHISAFNYGNAGDIILPIVLQDLFNQRIGIKKWRNIHVSKTITPKINININQSNAIVIGGGGLFLRDTNKNNFSGWQWSCSLEQLNKINVPIIMFAVGYNRFRGQEDFDPIFKIHFNSFVKKAIFVGIRNNGSINKLKEYLVEEELRKKLIFQPCMTTIISKIYPKLEDYGNKEDYIAINCAFDREGLRYKSDKILKSIAYVVKELSLHTKIKYYSHMETDKKILQYFNLFEIPFELIEFSSPKQMIKAYSKPRLVIGMRGHAQMIPFGCKTPILSIISHDKLKWFLDDISHPEWGVDVDDLDFENSLLNRSLYLYKRYNESILEITEQQEKLWQITKNNIAKIKQSFI